MAGGITFGAAAPELCKVVENGVCFDDDRVLSRTNEATKALLDEIIPVNGMMTVDLAGVVSPTNAAAGTQLWLPKEMENAIEVEVVTGTVRSSSDIRQGWYDIVSQFTYVDPAAAHDNPLVDLFLVADAGSPTILRRLYDYPGLSAGATVRITGAKRYVPMTSDADYLIIQNVRALKLMILALEREDNNAFDDGAKYRKAALELLQAEVKKHQLDPRNSLKRKANYQADLIAYVEGTLGRTRAKLALELPGFLARGKTEIGYLIDRAVQMLVDNRNQLALTGKLAVHESTAELTYTQPTLPTSALSWTDYNQIRLLVQSFVGEAGADNAALQQRAFELQQAQLTERMEFRRRTTYEATLAAANPLTMGYLVARLALDLPQGLKMTEVELTRVANSAEHRIMDRGRWKNTVQEVTASISSGYVLFPRDTESVLAASLCGSPARIQSRFFQFHENGPGNLDPECDSCAGMLLDEGEVLFSMTGYIRRKYKVLAAVSPDVTELRAIVKRRWIAKTADDLMVIQNYEAIRLMVLSILNQSDLNLSSGFANQAIDAMTRELQEYLAGIKPHIEVQTRGMPRLRMLR